MRRALALLLAALTVACTAPGVTPLRPGVGANASFVLANAGGLLALDENARVLGAIADLPPSTAASQPALHPDGKRIAFVLLVSASRKGFGSDIYIVGLDGSDLRPLVEHEEENAFYSSPRFDRDGVLYVHRRSVVIENGQYVGNDDSIVRFDPRTNDRRVVLKQAQDPEISPDGTTLVYVRVVNGQLEGLWRAAADGSGARPLLRTRDTFWYLQSPRFSRDGREIVFSAAGHSVTGSARALPRHAHLGVPSELFIAPLDGSGVRSVGQTGDDVVPAWSPDGSRIAYIGTGAFFILSVADGTVRTISQGQEFYVGDLVWVR